MSKEMDPYRPLTDWERRMLLRLVDAEFPGRDVLRDQIDHLLVSPIDENGSLDLRCEAAAVAHVEKRIPTEAEAVDRDGITIHYLLHVVAGTMKELEIYKDDSSRVMQHPCPDDVGPLILGSG